MIVLYDETSTVRISMQTFTGLSLSPDLSKDFFNAGSLEYDYDEEAYHVDDVGYCVDAAKDWKNYGSEFGGGEEAREYDKLHLIERCLEIEEINYL